MATMKELALFALTVLAVISPALAGLRTNCTDDAFCKDTNNDGDANAVCAAAEETCSCTGAYKANEAKDACVAKGLTDTCTDDADCSSVTNAKCTTNTCQCKDGYKTSGATCTAVYNITCSAVSDCAGLANAACTGSKCACATNYEEKDNVCKMKNGANAMEANIGIISSVLIMLSYFMKF